MPFPSHCIISHVILAALHALLPCAGAAQSLIDCAPPLRPVPVTEPRVQAEYASELREEYTFYFDEAQEFFHCLERARAVVTDEVNQAIADYGAIPETARD